MADDTTLRLRYPTSATLYTQIEAPDGTFWNGSAFAAFSVASWATFATSTPETPASSGRYVCQFPTSAAAGSYTWATYLRGGGSPVSTDVCVGSGSGYWDGATFGSVYPNSISANVLTYDWSTLGGSIVTRCAVNAFRFLRNRWAVAGGVLTVYDETNNTPAWTANVTSNAANQITSVAPRE